MTVERPAGLYDRITEWSDLTALVSAPQPRLRLGVLYGRRRYGKSFLLRRLVEATGGLYHLALEEEARPALDRFAAEASQLYAVPPPLRFAGWTEALTHVLQLLGGQRDGPQVLVLDEYPYLRRASPELDSVVQSLMDAAAGGTLGQGWTAPVTLVVCGSAMSVMTELLSGTAPMRGRATLDMPLEAFDYRQSREFWQIADPAVAFALHSVVGGAPGYRDLTAGVPVPRRPDQLAGWLAATVLNPSHAMFREDEYLLREDPRVTKEALYYSLLNGIAAGSRSRTAIASTIGRKASDIAHHLDVLVTAGFVTRDDDLLAARSPVYRVADPIVRFHELITRPFRNLLEDRKATQAWALAQATYRSNVVGPHFEALCREWTARYAHHSTVGAPLGPVRSLQVNDPKAERFELDVAAATRATQARRHKTIQVLGEAKATKQPRTPADLDRLDRCAALLRRRQGVSVARSAKTILFSLHGFSPELHDAARQRDDVELVDLQRIYEGS